MRSRVTKVRDSKLAVTSPTRRESSLPMQTRVFVLEGVKPVEDKPLGGPAKGILKQHQLKPWLVPIITLGTTGTAPPEVTPGHYTGDHRYCPTRSHIWSLCWGPLVLHHQKSHLVTTVEITGTAPPEVTPGHYAGHHRYCPTRSHTWSLRWRPQVLPNQKSHLVTTLETTGTAPPEVTPGHYAGDHRYCPTRSHTWSLRWRPQVLPNQKSHLVTTLETTGTAPPEVTHGVLSNKMKWLLATTANQKFQVYFIISSKARDWITR